MAYISPMLQNRLNTSSNNKSKTHEQIYIDLQKTAHNAKPNKAKAKLVNEGMMGNPITAVKDTFQSGKNFVKAVATGEMGDNSLGKINDLGLKAGAMLIATFLAAHAKTKTEAIMQFVGGATFLSAMSLWPKLFINLPARLVHGFRIDRKYISAQGDKKDFGLDNQFMVWDAYPEEQLRKDAKNAGIDYDSENGKEKIQRKIQKTTLQNRTLWMATAGFATPLISAMVGNAVEPHIHKAVVKHEFNKTKQIVDNGIESYIKGIKPNVQNASQLDDLLKSYQGKTLDDDFYKKLATLLNPVDFVDKLKDSDDIKPLNDFKSTEVAETLKQIQTDSFSTVNKEKLRELLQTATKTSLTGLGNKSLTPEEIEAIIGKIDKDSSIENLDRVLQKITQKDSIMSEVVGTDNEKFFSFIKQYNEGPIATMRARIKGYLDILNPVIGSKAESVYTDEITSTTDNLIKHLGFDGKTLSDISKGDPKKVPELISKTLQERLKGVEYGSDEYKAIIQELSTNGLSEEVAEVIKKLKENISTVISDTDEGSIAALNKAIMGDKDTSSGFVHSISQFIENKEIDLNTIKSRILMCANFESRLQSGDLKGLTEEQIQAARKLLYDGAISDFKCSAHLPNKTTYEGLIGRIFNKEQFSAEESVLPNIKGIIEDTFNIAKNAFKGTSEEEYLKCSSLTGLIKTTATKLSNNKSWMKVFGTMSAVLVATTLLVQPLFGNIKEEFPEDNKNGGAK